MHQLPVREDHASHSPAAIGRNERNGGKRAGNPLPFEGNNTNGYQKMEEGIKKAVEAVSEFFDQRKVGDVGPLGFRRSTDLKILVACLDRLLDEKILIPGNSRFMDLGCADGRVNLLLSYLTKISVGIELDEWTLDEYGPLKDNLLKTLGEDGFPLPPDNIFLYHGDSTDENIHRRVKKETGVEIKDFDLFYTYLVMHEEFAGFLQSRAKEGAIFLVYGLNKIMPTYPGFQLLKEMSPVEGILAVYRKES